MKKKILLLSGYDATSHRYWRDLLVSQISEYEWTQLSLPDRYFSWRIRGNSFSFAYQYREVLNQHYDLLIVTSMVDLASLKGLVPNLAKIPSLVYFHENQFVYPLANETSERAKLTNEMNAVNAQIGSFYSALCADKVLFNSQYNFDSFFQGLRKLLKKLPEKTPSSITEVLEMKAQVLPVPLLLAEINEINEERNNNQPLQIVWNHRWEYDKQPEVFFNALRNLKQSGQLFKLHLLGQSFRRSPGCFELAKTEFAQELLSFGFQPKANYYAVLNQADIVVSSALHDFQGLSLQEAMACGCVPIAPNRVAYPEYVPAENLYAVSECVETESINLYKKLAEIMSSELMNKSELLNLDVSVLIPEYQGIIETLLQTKQAPA